MLEQHTRSSSCVSPGAPMPTRVGDSQPVNLRPAEGRDVVLLTLGASRERRSGAAHGGSERPGPAEQSASASVPRAAYSPVDPGQRPTLIAPCRARASGSRYAHALSGRRPPPASTTSTAAMTVFPTSACTRPRERRCCCCSARHYPLADPHPPSHGAAGGSGRPEPHPPLALVGGPQFHRSQFRRRVWRRCFPRTPSAS